MGLTAAIVRLAAAMAAGAPSPPEESMKGCSFWPSDVKPIIQVRAGRDRAPLDLYLIGFSPHGRLAWVERRRGFESEEHTWLFEVVDLDRDRPVIERQLETRSPAVRSFCAKHGAAISRLLDRFEIAGRQSLALEQPDPTRDPTGVSIIAGRPDRQRYRTPYQISLSGEEGTQPLGTLWRVEGASGQDPLDPPRLAGILRSPFEPRVAVLATQRRVGTEGAAIQIVKALGGRLDQGWRPDAPAGARGKRP